MNARLSYACLAALALLVQGCSLSLQTPPRFLELEHDSAFDYRAATADGVVLAAREHHVDGDRGSNVSFWVEAVEARLRRAGGYALLDKKDVTTHAGLKGVQLRFGHDEEQRAFRYWVTIFVDGDDVYVIEAGGPEKAFAAAEPGVQASIVAFER